MRRTLPPHRGSPGQSAAYHPQALAARAARNSAEQPRKYFHQLRQLDLQQKGAAGKRIEIPGEIEKVPQLVLRDQHLRTAPCARAGDAPGAVARQQALGTTPP